MYLYPAKLNANYPRGLYLHALGYGAVFVQLGSREALRALHSDQGMDHQHPMQQRRTKCSIQLITG